MRAMDESTQLIEGARELRLALSTADAARLLQLLDELARWNRSYNLTAIRDRDEMLTHHLLDSISSHADLHGTTVADVGTGAGFPGLPLAVLNPQRRFTLIDSNGKKIRFVQHAARELQLANVEGLHGRVETLKGRTFDTVVARAFASLPDMTANIASLCGPLTRVLAMKGRYPKDEIDALQPPWRQQSSRELPIPGLNESRCVVVLTTG
jgi:16S rRNA (guanine527-N7)-methyltransferase